MDNQFQGYVIHRRAYRETSLLVDVFTLESGRFTLVAKGARGNTKSDRKSLLQPLQLLNFECRGRSALKNLGRMEALAPSIPLQGRAMYAAFYLNELIQRALPESEPVESLFSQYQICLQGLSEASNAARENQTYAENSVIEPWLRRFEFHLLEELGYLPDFSVCSVSGEPVHRDKFYQYILEQGFVECLQFAPNAISGEMLIQISEDNLTSESRRLAKQLMRLTLPLAIGDKPLKSRDLFV